jgi:hypothetical protein
MSQKTHSPTTKDEPKKFNEAFTSQTFDESVTLPHQAQANFSMSGPNREDSGVTKSRCSSRST